MIFKPLSPNVECFILSSMFTACSGLIGAKAGVIFARASLGTTFCDAVMPAAAMIGGALVSKMASNESAPVARRNAVVLGAALISAPIMYLYMTGAPMTDYSGEQPVQPVAQVQSLSGPR